MTRSHTIARRASLVLASAVAAVATSFGVASAQSGYGAPSGASPPPAAPAQPAAATRPPVLGFTTHALARATQPLHARCARVVTKETLTLELPELLKRGVTA